MEESTCGPFFKASFSITRDRRTTRRRTRTRGARKRPENERSDERTFERTLACFVGAELLSSVVVLVLVGRRDDVGGGSYAAAPGKKSRVRLFFFRSLFLSLSRLTFSTDQPTVREEEEKKEIRKLFLLGGKLILFSNGPALSLTQSYFFR